MIETYFLYTTILILAASSAYAAQHSKDAIQMIFARIFCFLCLFIPAALRYGIGRDYFSYYRIYENNFPAHMQRLEPGFVFIGNLSHWIGLSPHMFIAAISGITYALVCFCMPKKHFFVIIMFFILSFAYLDSYNIARQSLAMSVLLCGLFLFYGNRKITGFFLFVIASLIHYACLVTVPILIISQIKVNMYFRICLIIAFVLIGINESFLLWLVDIAASINPRNRALFYAIKTTQLNFGITYIIFSLPVILMLLNAKKILQQPNGNFILNLNTAFLSVIIMAYFVAIIGRFVNLLFFIPLFSMQILYNANKKYAKLYHIFLVFCFSAIFFRYIEYHSIDTTGFGISPYDSIFGGK